MACIKEIVVPGTSGIKTPISEKGRTLVLDQFPTESVGFPSGPASEPSDRDCTACTICAPYVATNPPLWATLALVSGLIFFHRLWQFLFILLKPSVVPL